MILAGLFSNQVTKWMLSKGQVLTMGTYDTLLLAFDMDGRVDEAESFWNVILQTHTRSVSKKLFSRIIALYDHHHHPEKILEVSNIFICNFVKIANCSILCCKYCFSASFYDHLFDGRQ